MHGQNGTGTECTRMYIGGINEHIRNNFKKKRF